MATGGDKYTFEGVIGIGTYGEVRHGQNANGRHVALKLVDLSRFDTETSKLIVKEVKILGMLDHKHCIKIVDVKEDVPYTGEFCESCACTSYNPMPNGACRHCSHYGGDHSGLETRKLLVIVQALAAGGEFFSLLMHTGAFPEDIARMYFRQLIEGLEYLHRKNIVHRDLKPENLVLDKNFNLQIVDFGLASLHDAGRPTLHSGVGSQPYSAPEVYYVKELYQGQPYQGEPADLWSAAVILFVMLAGRPPFVRPLTKTYGPKLKRCKHFIKLLRGQGFSTMSDSAKTLLLGMLKPNPEERFNLEQVKSSDWYNGALPANEQLQKIMDEKSESTWRALDREEMVDVLSSMRNADSSPVTLPYRDPFSGADFGISALSLHDTTPPVYRSFPHSFPHSHSLQEEEEANVEVEAAEIEVEDDEEAEAPMEVDEPCFAFAVKDIVSALVRPCMMSAQQDMYGYLRTNSSVSDKVFFHQLKNNLLEMPNLVFDAPTPNQLDIVSHSPTPLTARINYGPRRVVSMQRLSGSLSAAHKFFSSVVVPVSTYKR